MPTRAELEQELAFWRKAFDEARDEANKARMRMRDAAGIIRTIEGQLGTRLRDVKKLGNVKNVTSEEHGLATSKGRSWNDLTKAANAKEFTLTQLAKRCGVSVATLSLAQKGERSIKETVAQQIEALTGFKATKANWPGGIV